MRTPICVIAKSHGRKMPPESSSRGTAVMAQRTDDSYVLCRSDIANGEAFDVVVHAARVWRLFRMARPLQTTNRSPLLLPFSAGADYFLK